MTVGIDILEVSRVENLVKLNKIFLQSEIDYINKFANKNERICGLFCAKEAVFKSLNLSNLNHKDIEICHQENGKPYVKFYNQTLEYFNQNFDKIDISISHTKTMATAIAIATEKPAFKPKCLWFFEFIFFCLFSTSCNAKCAFF